MTQFPKKLKELREEMKLKQADLARVFHVHQSYISKWELGIREPDFSTLVKISKFFKVSTDYLLGEED